MKHYLVDTNVIIDMLLNREDADAACAVFDGAERGEYVLHGSGSSTCRFFCNRHGLKFWLA